MTTRAELDEMAATLKTARRRLFDALLDYYLFTEPSDGLGHYLAERVQSALDYSKVEHLYAASELEAMRNG